MQMMASTTFLQQLQNFPKDTISDETVELLEPYFRAEDYFIDTAKRVCGDVAGLLSWTRAMSFFFTVNKEVLPLKVIIVVGINLIMSNPMYPGNRLIWLCKKFDYRPP